MGIDGWKTDGTDPFILKYFLKNPLDYISWDYYAEQ
jgi:hypothetical protein